jgi:hypothetical protein
MFDFINIYAGIFICTEPNTETNCGHRIERHISVKGQGDNDIPVSNKAWVHGEFIKNVILASGEKLSRLCFRNSYQSFQRAGE